MRQPWPHEKLVREQALALSNSLDLSTQKNYGSACNSYLSFIRDHDLSVEPTPDTLSFYVVYMCHHIGPRSVATYLSGIVSELQPYFPSVREARHSRIVKRTLKGCHKMKAKPVTRKRTLTLSEVNTILTHFQGSADHDDLLFVSMFLSGFFALLRLGELAFPDDPSICDWRKVIRRSSVKI